MKVRALRACFTLGTYREAGAEFEHPADRPNPCLEPLDGTWTKPAATPLPKEPAQTLIDNIEKQHKAKK